MGLINKIDKKYRSLILTILSAVIVTILVSGSMLRRADHWMQDAIYQQPAYEDRIVVIGIDEEAFERLGAYQTWDRNIMASALEMIAEAPEDERPAVIAIDTLYTGETDPAADARLAAAAEALGNVVTAGSATIGTVAEEDDNGNFYFNRYKVLAYDESFDALRKVTTVGHINAMYDTDMVLRHALLYITPGEGYGDADGRIYSMAYETAKKYLESIGETVQPPKTDSHGHFYVSYVGGPGAFYDQVSIADLIEGEVSPDYFAGKIVFIGPYAVGLQDQYFTPIDRARQMYGVEFQANVVRAIIDADYKTELPDIAQRIILLVICLVSFFLFIKSDVKKAGALGAGLIVLFIGVDYAAYRAGLIVHPLWIPAAILILYVISIVAHYIKSVIEKQQVTRTFERYVAPEIVKEIMKEGMESLSLGGKVCDIAVLFVDVRGFTTMSERLDPEKVVFILNKYLTMASDCVERNKGTLDKFVGDAMMAFWGAPLPQEDAVYNAVKTAWEIVEGAARVSDELKAEIGEELRVGVGVNFGKAVVGNMGASKHMDYTAIGDTVNTAARLEANAPGGCVYISRAVADELGDRITFTSLGATIKLKGKAEGFEVLKLESIQE